MTKLCKGILLGLYGVTALCVVTPMSVAMAQEAGSSTEVKKDQPKTLDAVQVLGSRRISTSTDTDSLVPVDVIPLEKAAEQGPAFDLAQTLQYTSPSFNSTRQTGADGADLVDSAALRGLGSDQTLVLLNGKRYHTTALVNLFGARNRGNTGTDLNTIPVLAIDRVEILRDGAAAQYGSDAIAGVMNIALKKRRGCEAIFGYGQYSEGDGENYIASGYCGMEIGNDGNLALTAEYQDRGRSDRSGPGNPRTIGDSKIENRTLYINGDLPLGEVVNMYFTAGYQTRDASSAAFARGGIGSDDIPSRNSEQMYPDGFVPFINGDIEDRHATVGAWWMMGEWRADLSSTYGFNELLYNISNTLNASIATQNAGISPSRFDAGGFLFRQNTTNFDVTRYFDGWLKGTNVAFGAEYRDENYQIFAGEPGSFIDADGPGGGNAGSQGFPGFQPGDATDSSRSNYAVYGDIEAGLTDKLTADFALRFEDFSDFGSTLNGKLALAFRASDNFLLRGSYSTGFRAPSLQQRFFSSTFTDFISGVPTDVVLAPNGGPLARAAGIPDLKEETSNSYTLGFTWKIADNTTLSVDGYRIDIDDRIVLSGRFDDTDPNIGAALQSLGVGEAQFFVNSVDTETTGVDVTFSHDSEWAGGQLNTYAALNVSNTDITSIHPPASLQRPGGLLDERDILFIENGAPKQKAIIGFDYTRNAWNGGFKIIHFGSQTLGTFSGTASGVPNAHYDAKTSADLSVSYSFTENLKLTVGGANIFNVHPTSQNPDETDNGFKYDSVQFGLNGAAYFARLFVKF